MGVITFINSWLKDIVVLFILISIAEIALPKGNTKKYVNLVIGLLIIFTIISPFTKLLNLDFSIDKVVFNYTKPENYKSLAIDDFYDKQEKQIEKMYIEKIRGELGELIEAKTDYELINADILILKDESNFGQVEHLTIYIRKKIPKDSSSRIRIERIEPIEINNSIEKEISKDNKDESTIKELISNVYGFNTDKINIIIYEK